MNESLNRPSEQTPQERTTSYTDGRREIEMRGKAHVKKLTLEQAGGKENLYEVSIPVSILDPDTEVAQFRGEKRYSQYKIIFDAASKTIAFGQRIDQTYNEETGAFEYNGGIYKLDNGELAQLSSVTDISEAIENTRPED